MYPPPANGADGPMFAQNAAIQGADAAQPSEGTPPKPNEKKEGEKSDKAEDDAEKNAEPQRWNFHAQTTVVAQGDPGFPAKYSGPNSLNSAGERQGTLTADLFAGMPLWQRRRVSRGFADVAGLRPEQTFGLEAFPNGDAYKAGTEIPDFMVAHFFVRQTFGLGGEQEDVPDGPLTLPGKQDISRLTFTVGRLSPTDIFDNNTYAHDPHTQFMNWAADTNLTWDYPSDTVGYTTGLAVELNQPDWAVRYGLFQMPGVAEWFHRRRPDFHVARRRERWRFLAIVGNDDGTGTPLQDRRSSGGDSVSGLARPGGHGQLRRGDCPAAG